MKERDDNNWLHYTGEYMRQIIETYKNGGAFFLDKDDPSGDLLVNKKIHSNSRKIYQVAYGLKPASILEVGCGGCYHIKNLRALLPKSEVHGIDISRKQISFGMWFCDLNWDGLSVMDATREIPQRKYEFVFTQAVVMHQSTGNATKIMENIRAMSSRYVFMIENPGHHGGIDEWNKLMKPVFEGWRYHTGNEFGSHYFLFSKT